TLCAYGTENFKTCFQRPLPSSAFRLHAIEDFVNLFVALFAALLQARVGARFQELKPLLNLLVVLQTARRKPPFSNRRLDGAVRLALVAATREATLGGQLLDVC